MLIATSIKRLLLCEWAGLWLSNQVVYTTKIAGVATVLMGFVHGICRLLSSIIQMFVTDNYYIQDEGHGHGIPFVPFGL